MKAICECGSVTGQECEWSGPKSETVRVELMPEHLRASHEAAGNCGVWPGNGAERLRISRDCLEALLESEGEWLEVIDGGAR